MKARHYVFFILASFQFVPAKLHDAIIAFDGTPEAAENLPTKLSLAGLYTDIKADNKTVSEGIIPFAVNSPLWSDASQKERWIVLPAGGQVIPTEKDRYQFPDKTVMVKNFALEGVVGDSLTRRLIETRFLVFRKLEDGDAWHGLTYRWNDEQKEADLVSQVRGEDKVYTVSHDGLIKGKAWRFPSRKDCAECHTGRGVLGFITPQLNRPSLANPSINQLQDLMNKAVLAHNPIAGKAQSFRWVGLNEKGPGASLAARSLSYLASNCSHCHGNETFKGGVPHDFDYFDTTRSIEGSVEGGYVGRLATFPRAGYSKLIHAGYPDSSLVMMRLMARGNLEGVNPDQMPPLATFQPDSAAAKAIRDWICAMKTPPTPSEACKLPKVQDEASYWAASIHPRNPGLPGKYADLRATLRGKLLEVEAEPPVSRIRLFDRMGRLIPLRKLSARHYLLEQKTQSGLYFLRYGSKTVSIRASP